MTWLTKTNSAHRTSMKLVAGAALCAISVLSAFAGTASAQGRGNDRRDNHHSWNGGYYRAPPVIYGSPYGQTYYYGSPTYYRSPTYYPPTYYAPPLVYGPGVSLNFRLQ